MFRFLVSSDTNIEEDRTDDDGAYDVDASGGNGNGDKGDDGGVDNEVFRCTEQILSQLEVQAMQVNIIITIMIINMM